MMWQLKYQDAVEEGRVEGLAEGRAEGRLEAKFELARAMIADGEPIDKIMRYTHLPHEDIGRLMA